MEYKGRDRTPGMIMGMDREMKRSFKSIGQATDASSFIKQEIRLICIRTGTEL